MYSNIALKNVMLSILMTIMKTPLHMTHGYHTYNTYDTYDTYTYDIANVDDVRITDL